MGRVHLDSSTVTWVEYHDDAATLVIEFTSGAVYRYLDVPPPVFDALVAAESAGRFFNEHIRGVYRYARV